MSSDSQLRKMKNSEMSSVNQLRKNDKFSDELW